MKAVVLAAGEGNRMRPLTYTRPKVMLPLANKPILEHLLLAVSQAGIKEFIIVVGYRDDQIRDYFEDGRKWGLNIEYVTQRRQLGTADALKAVEPLTDGNFLLINGDNIFKQEEVREVASRGGDTIGVVEVGDTSGLGVVAVEGDRVVLIQEKTKTPSSNLVNAGLYLLTPEIFKAVSRTSKSPRGEYEITDSLQLMIEEKNNLFYHKLSYWLNLSYSWDLLDANQSLLEGCKAENLGEVEPNVVIKGAVSIGENTIVRSGSYIVGPVIIGQDCDIGPNCYLRPFTSVGNQCHIGASSEVKNSIIMNGSKIPHHNYVGDSVIGEGCNFGSGARIANLRLDKKNIRVFGIDTGRRKLGAIIGDRVEIGINACINTGSIIGNETHIGPGAQVSGIILPGSRVY